MRPKIRGTFLARIKRGEEIYEHEFPSFASAERWIASVAGLKAPMPWRERRTDEMGTEWVHTQSLATSAPIAATLITRLADSIAKQRKA